MLKINFRIYVCALARGGRKEEEKPTQKIVLNIGVKASESFFRHQPKHFEVDKILMKIGEKLECTKSSGFDFHYWDVWLVNNLVSVALFSCSLAEKQSIC